MSIKCTDEIKVEFMESQALKQINASVQVDSLEHELHVTLKRVKIRNEKIQFDIDAHKMCALTFIMQARDSARSVGDPGKSLEDARQHVERIREFVEFYGEN